MATKGPFDDIFGSIESRTGIDLDFIVESYKTAWTGTSEENQALAQRAIDEQKEREHKIGTALEDITRYVAGKQLIKRLPPRAKAFGYAWMAHYAIDQGLKLYKQIKERKNTDPTAKSSYATAIGIMREQMETMTNRYSSPNKHKSGAIKKGSAVPDSPFATEDDLHLNPVELDLDPLVRRVDRERNKNPN